MAEPSKWSDEDERDIEKAAEARYRAYKRIKAEEQAEAKAREEEKKKDEEARKKKEEADAKQKKQRSSIFA